MNKVKDKPLKRLIKLFKNKRDLVDVWLYKNPTKMDWHGAENNPTIKIDDIIVNNDFIDRVKIIIVLRLPGTYYRKNTVKLPHVFESKYSIGKGNRLLKIECITSWKWRLHTREDLFKNIDDSLDPIPKCDTFRFKINRLSVRD